MDGERLAESTKATTEVECGGTGGEQLAKLSQCGVDLGAPGREELVVVPAALPTGLGKDRPMRIATA